MPRNHHLRHRLRAICFGLILLLPAASGLCAESYKCQNDERVVRRDRGCLPGERLLEITPAVDLRVKRNPPISIAPPEKPGKPVLLTRDAAAAEMDTTHSTDATAGTGSPNTGRMSGVIGGGRVVADTLPAGAAGPAWSVPSWSDPPQKWLDSASQLALYCRTCALEQFNSPACGNFRDWTVVAGIVLVMLVLVQILRRLLREQKALNEHKKWLEAQAKVADAETMKQHTWEGDAALDVDLTEEELAAAIRNAARPSPQT